MSAPPEAGTAEHWDHRYASIGDANVSWFQADPATSVELIGSVAGSTASVVDVGGGASHLVDRLLESGYRDLTVVDLSTEALTTARDRVGEAPVTWVVADVRDWQPVRTFDVWHDRAAFHFLVDPDEQQQYWRLVHEAVVPGGHVVIATFATDGPDQCSGLPVERYDRDTLLDVMGEGFTLVESRTELHTTPSGAVQPFTWVLARRS